MNIQHFYSAENIKYYAALGIAALISFETQSLPIIVTISNESRD